MLCEPCVFGPRWNLWRLIVPAKPFPIEMPATLIVSPAWNASTVTVSPTVSSERPRNSTRLRCGSTPFLRQMPELALRELALGDGVERELHGFVAVRVHGLDLDDGARAGLDDRHRGDDAGLRVEDLRHPELLADDSLHFQLLCISELDLDVDACREIEAHQRVHGLRRRAVDVDQPLVRAHLEVLARVLVLERAPDHAVDVLLGGQGHGAGDRRAGSLRRLDDVASRLVDLVVVVALEPDADLLLRHVSPRCLPT